MQMTGQLEVLCHSPLRLQSASWMQHSVTMPPKHQPTLSKFFGSPSLPVLATPPAFTRTAARTEESPAHLAVAVDLTLSQDDDADAAAVIGGKGAKPQAQSSATTLAAQLDELRVQPDAQRRKMLQKSLGVVTDTPGGAGLGRFAAGSESRANPGVSAVVSPPPQSVDLSKLTPLQTQVVSHMVRRLRATRLT